MELNRCQSRIRTQIWLPPSADVSFPSRATPTQMQRAIAARQDQNRSGEVSCVKSRRVPRMRDEIYAVMSGE